MAVGLISDYSSLRAVLRYSDLPASGQASGDRIIVASIGQVARWNGSSWALTPVVQGLPVGYGAANVLALDDDTGATADADLDIDPAAAGACAGGATPSAAQVDTAIATAVAPLDINFATVAQQINAILSALKAAGLMEADA